MGTGPFSADWPRKGPLAFGERDHLTNNATKPNDAWWRCVKPGQRNPPVTICLDRRCRGSFGSEMNFG